MNWKLAKFTVIDFSLSRIFLVSSNPGDKFEIQDDEDVDVLRRHDSHYRKSIIKPVDYFGKSRTAWWAVRDSIRSDSHPSYLCWQWYWWHRCVSDFIMMTDSRCWRLFCYVTNIFGLQHPSSASLWVILLNEKPRSN